MLSAFPEQDFESEESEARAIAGAWLIAEALSDLRMLREALTKPADAP